MKDEVLVKIILNNASALSALDNIYINVSGTQAITEYIKAAYEDIYNEWLEKETNRRLKAMKDERIAQEG